MKLQFELVDEEQVDVGRLSLHRYVAADGSAGYEVRIDGAFLMASHGAAGERAMVPWALEAAGAGPHRVLVGGLGAGHTLRAVLERDDVSRVDVVEVGAKVVNWNRTHFGNGDLLDDPRTRVVVDDVVRYLERSAPERFDAILLDVDNGPGWLAAADNERLYEPAGLASCEAALRPGGVVAFWSPAPHEALACALAARFADVHTRLTDEAATPGLVVDAVILGRRPAAPHPR